MKQGRATMAATIAATVIMIIVMTVGLCDGQQTVKEIFGRSTKCSTECKASTKFLYETNMVYVFDYHSAAKFVGGSREPQLGITARAHITVAEPCEMILAVSHVRLGAASDARPGFSAALERNSLRFAFQDGRVISLCPDVDEPAWVLNFKRALLSTFQNAMPDLKSKKNVEVQEEEVSGTCTNSYSTQADKTGAVNVTKTRASSCVPPPEPRSSNVLTNLLQNLPFLDTEQKCMQIITEGILRETICRENVQYPQFLINEGDPPIAVLTSRLLHVYNFKVDFVVIPNYEARRCSLMLEWENTEEQSPPSDWLSSISDILEWLPTTAPAPALFYRLTEILRTLSYEQITETISTIAPELWETVSMALLRIGSEPAMQMLVDFENYGSVKRVSLQETRKYLISMFEVNSPMIDIIQEMLSSRWSYSKDDYMPLHKLKNYCLNNPQCTDDERIKKIFSNILEKAGKTSCKQYNSSNPYSSIKVVDNLDLLTAVGRWNNSSDPELDYCIKSNDSELQYSALKLLRNSPCDVYDFQNLLKLSQNGSLDSYAQIVVYLTMMQCPVSDLESYLYNKLETEGVNQVTSYIWTHLTNQPQHDWIDRIVKNPQHKRKYQDGALKFSRNYHKEIIIGNNVLDINCDIVFSGLSFRPQYARFRISSTNFTPSDIFEFEVREKNVTRFDYSSITFGENYEIDNSPDYFSIGSNESSAYHYYTIADESSRKFRQKKTKTNLYSVMTVKFMGVEVCSDERRLDSIFDNFGITRITEHVMETAYSFINAGFFSYVLSTVNSWFGIDYSIKYFKKFDLIRRYPTSIGMPFECHANLTKGIHSNNIFPSTAKQFEASMMIDATHTNVGMKVVAKTVFLPGFNISKAEDGYSVIIKLPEKKHTLFEFICDKYNVENNKLTPKFPNESGVESFCLPGVRNVTGSTLCVEYCPKSKWWPASNVRYSVVYERDNDVAGYNITGRYKNTFYEMSVEVLEKPECTWRASVYHLAHFINVKLLTPYMSLNGSGTFKSEVLRLNQPGQALNITGMLSCNKEVAPFILTGESLINNDTEKMNTFNVFFFSSIFEGTVLTSYEMGQNNTLDMTIPYRIKNNATQNLRITASGVKYNLTSGVDTEALSPYGISSITRSECGATISFSQFPDSAFSLQSVYDNARGFNSTDAWDGTLTMACEDHQMVASVATRCGRKVSEYNCTMEAQKPNKTIIWNKFLHLSDESFAFSNLTCNDELVFGTETAFGANFKNGLYSRASLLVPCREPNTTHSLLQMKYDQGFNLFKQEYHILCSKSYLENSFKFNMTAGIDTDGGKAPVGHSTTLQHFGRVEISKNDKVDFAIDGKSKISNNMQDIDFTANVQTPFERWEKDAFKLALSKKADRMKATLTEKRRKQEAKEYLLQGSVDYDVINNLVK